MILKPKGYKTPVPSVVKIFKATIKNLIKAFVKKPMDYSEIIKHVQKKYNLTNDQIYPIIKEVELEWHPPKEVEND